MRRVNPSLTQKKRLLRANAFRCCVCKRRSLGFHFHHIDGNSSNTRDENLAVLCVEDHDCHHRPIEYAQKTKHLELDPKDILRLKNSWEAFVAEAKQPNPKVIATLSFYGTEDLIHSLQLVMQWPDERIEYERSFHLLDGDLDRLTDGVFEELNSIGPRVKMAVIKQPLPVEHCPCCGTGLSRTMKSAVVTRLTDPAWATDSACAIYINPNQASLGIVFSLGENQIVSGSLHVCQSKYLHYHCDGVDDIIPIRQKTTVRSQAIHIVQNILMEWEPAKTFLGTGNPDKPERIEGFVLPNCWEKITEKKVKPEKHE